MVKKEGVILTTESIDDTLYSALLKLNFRYEGTAVVRYKNSYESFYKFSYHRDGVTIVLGFKDSTATYTYKTLFRASLAQ